MFRKILVANRDEMMVRVMAAYQAMGIRMIEAARRAGAEALEG